MRGRRAPTDPPRRDDIAAAVAAYDSANPLAPLPRNAARLLTAMFPATDVYQGSLEDIAALGFSRRDLPGTLQRLVSAGFLSREFGQGSAPDTYRLHLPPLVRR
jgi:hypothetical protein